jgi:UDP-N-acetylglucosamine--N-acetylmuramyl-(pentapeptide) pyrophosphoryl-undecaprenol N-acetylglucosamine transferase
MDREILAHAGLPHRSLAVGPMRGTAPHRLVWNTLRLLRATAQAGSAMARFRAEVLLATGGYVSAPAMLAAALRRTPIVLYLPDASPGWAVRAFAPLATRIALSFPVTRKYFRGSKVIVTGYPVRPEFLRADKERARQAFGLSGELPVVTVMGGSSGAHSINLAVMDALEPLLYRAQVIHLCGEMDEPRLREQRSGLEPEIRTRYHLFRYLHRGVADALAASDLVVCRSGASVLAELPSLRLPGILIPHPFGHQDDNADYLVEQGGAIKVPDARLEQGALLPAIISLLEDRPRLELMAAEMGRLARPEAANNIASAVRSVAR